MSLDAGLLRHWVDIEELIESRDSDGGITREWVLYDHVPAAIEPLSAREFIAAQGVQSAITCRIVIRYQKGVTAKMRISHEGKVYNIHGVLSDKDSLREYLTLPCSEGVNAGG
ncbi:MAG: phage head closure protein [Acidobacteria bacterium]|nr:phage head closure protein [Acidobacteriota bacterium]